MKSLRKLFVILLIGSLMISALPVPTVMASVTANKQTVVQKLKKKVWFAGKIGDTGIHAKLDITGNKVSGVYYYDKYKKNINLSGNLDYYTVLKDYHTLTLTEDTEQKATLEGIMITGDYIEGCWRTGDKIYPMYLIREGSKQTPPKKPGQEIIKLNGHWNGINKTYFAGSEADIYVLFNDLIYYELFAMNGTASGELSSFGRVEGKKASTVFLDKVYYTETNDNITYEFSMDGSNLNLDSNQYDYWCGMGANFDLQYTKKDIKVPVPTALELEIVDNEEQEELFNKLVGDQYGDFIQYTQYVMYEDMTLDGKNVKAGASYLRGMNGCCYYILSDDYIYAAIDRYDSIDYYTNNSKYAKKLPKPMKEWAGDRKINYHYVK